MLRRTADDLETVLEEAWAAHRRYAIALERASSWRSFDSVVSGPLRQRRTDIAMRMARTLAGLLREEADDADMRLRGLTVTGRITPSSPADDDPATVAAWWAGLPDEERALVLRDHPGWAGRADGLPVKVRHAANTRVLERTLESPPDHLTDEDLSGLQALSVLPDDAQLYLLDVRSGPVRAGVLLGSLDTASGVLVHVPGATTTVAYRLERELTWLNAVRDEVGRTTGERGSVSVLDWIGYQTPLDIAVRRDLGDTGLRWITPGQATDDRYAREGAPSLQRCLRGLRTVAPDARLVASGHSYGGSVIGLALLTAEETLVDAMVVTGCPGLFATSVSALQAPDEEVYAFVAAGDLIARLGMFGVETAKVEGIRLLSPVARMVVDADGARRFLRPPVGHEDYYTPGTTSLAAVAAVATGLPARIKTVPWSWLARQLGRVQLPGSGDESVQPAGYPVDREHRVD